MHDVYVLILFNFHILVDLEAVKRIQLGQATTPFLTHTGIFGKAVERSISIIYINQNGKETSLDLVSENFILKIFFMNQ